MASNNRRLLICFSGSPFPLFIVVFGIYFLLKYSEIQLSKGAFLYYDMLTIWYCSVVVMLIYTFFKFNPILKFNKYSLVKLVFTSFLAIFALLLVLPFFAVFIKFNFYLIKNIIQVIISIIVTVYLIAVNWYSLKVR
jgi:hypothetical protein